MPHSSEVSGHYKQMNGITMFYSFPNDVEIVLWKGLNAICTLAEIGQCSISNLCDIDDARLNATAHE